MDLLRELHQGRAAVMPGLYPWPGRGRRGPRRGRRVGQPALFGGAGRSGEGKDAVGKAHQRAGNAQPHQPVGEQRPGQGQHLGVFVRHRPVLGQGVEGAQAEGVEQQHAGRGFQVGRQQAHQQKAHHQPQRRDKGVHRVAGQHREAVDDGAGQHRVGHDEQAESLQIRRQLKGAHPGRVVERRAQRDGQQHAQQGQHRHQHATGKAAPEVAALFERRGVQHRRVARARVAGGRVGHNGRDEEQAQHGHGPGPAQDGKGRVDVQVAQVVAHLDAGHEHGQEGEPEGDGQEDVGQRVLAPGGQLEAKEGSEHERAGLGVNESSLRGFPLDGGEKHVFEAGLHGLEAGGAQLVAHHVQQRLPGQQLGRNHGVFLLVLGQLGFLDGALPNAAL